MYTLAVIDMQDHFMAGQKDLQSTIKNCELLITKAIEDEAHIMFVEYFGYQKTISKLTDIIKNRKYENVSYIQKRDDNGGQEIADAIKKSKLPKNVKFCGVNTEYCVFASVYGYLHAAKRSKIEVVTSACGSKYSHEEGIAKFIHLAKENKNVKII